MESRRTEDQLKKLEMQVWDTVRASAPYSKETQEHLRLVAKWTEASAAVLRKAQMLAGKGQASAGQQLLDEHNAARPRRRPGRPRKMLPRYSQVRHAVREQLKVLALEQLQLDPVKAQQLVDHAVASLLPENRT